VLNVIGFWLTISGDYPEADRYLTEALEMRRRLFDEHQPDLASSLMHMALLRDAQGKYSEALELAQNAKQIDTEALSADHWRTAVAESAQGAALTGLGRYREADSCLTHSYAILSKNGGAPLIYRTIAQRYLDTLHRTVRSGATSAAASTLAAKTAAQAAAAAKQLGTP
jgi:tetratricopeptide (TPR) repeat protein